MYSSTIARIALGLSALILCPQDIAAGPLA